jgi:hypothetical protein
MKFHANLKELKRIAIMQYGRILRGVNVKDY